MKATFVLLANTEIHNYVRKLAWEIHSKYHTGISICRLPPHVSLKQPFKVSNLTALESYMNELAVSITPFEINLTKIQLLTMGENDEIGLLWLDVQQTDTLHQLHKRINQELNQRFKNTQAEMDGESYHFHISVVIGGQPMEVYRKIYAEIPDPKVNLKFIVSELAMFVYDEPISLIGDYMTYKILPISDQRLSNQEVVKHTPSQE